MRETPLTFVRIKKEIVTKKNQIAFNFIRESLLKQFAFNFKWEIHLQFKTEVAFNFIREILHIFSNYRLLLSKRNPFII